MTPKGPGTAKNPEPTVADVLTPYVTEQCRVILRLSDELRAGLDEQDTLPAEPLHDVRVACRRLRSMLRVYGEVFSVPEAGRLSDDARWYGIRLGAVRDLDVLGPRIDAALLSLGQDLVLHDPTEELHKQIAYRRRIAVADLRDAWHSEAYADLADQLVAWQQRPMWSTDAHRSAGRVKRYVKQADKRLGKRLRRAADAIAADDPDTDELIHSARKSAKRHRYAVEAAAPVLGPAADKVITDRKEVQDLLGEYQDSRLASVFLRDLGGIPGRNGFTFGLLFAREAEHRRRLRKRIRKLAG